MRFFYLVTLIPFIAVAQSKINICNQYGNALQDDTPGNVKHEVPLNNEMFRKISNRNGGFQTTYHLKNISTSGLKVLADLMNKDQLVRPNFLVGKLDSAKPFFAGKKSGNLIFSGFPGGRIIYKAKYWKITSGGEINVSDNIDRGDLDDLNACLVLTL